MTINIFMIVFNWKCQTMIRIFAKIKKKIKIFASEVQVEKKGPPSPHFLLIS
jgi:hypothetical protein